MTKTAAGMRCRAESATTPPHQCELQRQHPNGDPLEHQYTNARGKIVKFRMPIGRPSEKRVTISVMVLPETVKRLDKLNDKLDAGSRGKVIDILAARETADPRES